MWLGLAGINPNHIEFRYISIRTHVSACHLVPVSPMWTKIGTNKRFDPISKALDAFLEMTQF